MWLKFLRAVKTREHRVASTTWVVALAATVYTFVPLDLIPELLLGPLGFADDLSIWAIFAILLTREKHRWQAALPAQ